MILAALALQDRLPMQQWLRFQRSAPSTNAGAMPAVRAGMPLSSSPDLCGLHCNSVARHSSHDFAGLLH